MVPARILVLRHGQSTWNAEGRWQGQEDPPLSTLGVLQARHAAAKLGTFDAIAASDLKRAATTAEIIAAELGVGPVALDPDLRERNAGAFQGLTRPEIEERFPGMLAAPYVGAHGLPPGWEDDEHVAERAVRALAKVAAGVGDGGTAVVVSHGGVLHVLERVADASERDQRVANLGGRWFELGPGHLRALEPVHVVDPGEITIPDEQL